VVKAAAGQTERLVSFGIYLHRSGRGRTVAVRNVFREALKRWFWDGASEQPYQIGTPSGITVELWPTGPGRPTAGG
jgi:hypothetical protein